LTLASAKTTTGISPALAAVYLAWASAVSVLFSIAASQILLGVAVAMLLVARWPLRLPRVWLPLALFMTGTVLSLLLSGNMRAGLPQIRKFYVYLMLVVVFSAFRALGDVRRLIVGWAVTGGLAAVAGLVQFAWKVRGARLHGGTFYDFYVWERIKGFTSNWQTFAFEMMIVLLVAGAFLLFSPRARSRAFWVCLSSAGLVGAALLLTYTRGAWLATACAGAYLLWSRKRWLLAAVPVLLGLLLWINPGSVRVRFQSAFQPRDELDSNQHRVVCWKTGWAMIQAHPWFGVGPEMVLPRLMEYVPWEYRRPVNPLPLPNGWYGHLHNLYIHYAAERGLPTALALVWLLAMALWDFLGALRRLPAGPGEAKFILHGAVAVLVGIVVGGLFEVNLGHSEVLALFLAVVACGYVAVDHLEHNEPAAH
jgi:O-antigen ligase